MAYGWQQLISGYQQDDFPRAVRGTATTVLAAGVLVAQMINSMLNNQLPAQGNLQVMTDAMNMVTGHHESVDLTDTLGRNRQNVIDHLMDIASTPRHELRDRVRQAVVDANDDPERLARNLLRLTTAQPPVLSSRPTSSPQP